MCPPGLRVAAGEGASERGLVMLTGTVSLKVWEGLKAFAVSMGKLEEVRKAEKRLLPALLPQRCVNTGDAVCKADLSQVTKASREAFFPSKPLALILLVGHSSAYMYVPTGVNHCGLQWDGPFAGGCAHLQDEGLARSPPVITGEAEAEGGPSQTRGF